MADRRAAGCGCDVGDGTIMLTFPLEYGGLMMTFKGTPPERSKARSNSTVGQFT